MALHQDELKLVGRLIAGDKVSAARFADLADRPIWSAIVALVGDNAEGEAAFRAVLTALSANTFARLARYDGRVSLADFLVLETRNWASEHTAGLFATDPSRAWRRFERLFKADFARLAAACFPKASAADREDALRNLDLALVENDYRKIRAYRGDRAFSGYILTVAQNELRDLKRKQDGRLRLPERIKRLSNLHQAVFRAGAWRRVALEVRSMKAALLSEIEPEPTADEVRAVIDELAADIVRTRDDIDGDRKPRRPISLDDDGGGGALEAPDVDTPEIHVIRAEQQTAQADRLAKALRQAETDLQPLDRAYLNVLSGAWGEPPKPAAIAALLGVPVKAIYDAQARIRRFGQKLKLQETKSVEASV